MNIPIKKIFAFTLLLALTLPFNISTIAAQEIGVGDWKYHLNYRAGEAIEKIGNRIYCGTENGLYYLTIDDNQIHPLSPLDGFSGTAVTAMTYDSKSNYLFIAYQNGTLDIVKNNQIESFSAIEATQIIGDKRINTIDIHENTAYFSTTFGVIEFDIRKQDFGTTYFGPQDPGLTTFGVAIKEDSIYLSSANGLLKAPYDKGFNLKDPNVWQTISNKTEGPLGIQGEWLYTKRDSALVKYNLNSYYWEVLDSTLGAQIRSIDKTRDTLFIATVSDTYLVAPDGEETRLNQTEITDLVIGENGQKWYTHERFSLIRISRENGLKYYFPNGPGSRNGWSGHYADGKVYCTGGRLKNDFSAAFSPAGYYTYQNGSWRSFDNSTSEDFDKINVRDVLNVSVSPKTGNVFLASFVRGLIETDGDGNIIEHYTETNSKLKTVNFSDDIIRCPDAKFDKTNNLWMTNNLSPDPLVVKTAEGDWYSYNSGMPKEVLDLEIDDAGQKWIQLYQEGVVVFDDNGTLENKADDRFIQLDNRGDQGNFPSSQVNDITKDKEGNIWLGTNDGIAVFFDPESLFQRNNISAQQIFIEDNGEGGYLLSGETVNAITVDGANDKWMATNNGVWHVSADGSEILKRFTEKNSPLSSNQVNDIVIHQGTGEVFFLTDNGIISYRSEATEGGETNTNVYAFPNPVKPDYSGPITIKGLVSNANVKITDVNNQLVTEMQAKGGQAVWDGTNLNGHQVSSGVYFVYSSDEFGEETVVTKIMIISK